MITGYCRVTRCSSATAASAPVSSSSSPSPWTSPPSFSLTLQTWPKGCALVFFSTAVPPCTSPPPWSHRGTAILRSCPLSAGDKAHCWPPLPPVPQQVPGLPSATCRGRRWISARLALSPAVKRKSLPFLALPVPVKEYPALHPLLP